MKLRRVCLGTVLGWGIPLVAVAQIEDSLIKPYFKIYPEFKVENIGRPSRIGDVVGNMGTQRSNTSVLSRHISERAEVSRWEWSNSYVGLRADNKSNGHNFGFDLQYEVNFQGDNSRFDNMKDNLTTRDAYLFYDHETFGRVQAGKFDSIYKDWGDRYTMLGLTSGNFISSARLLSQAGWRGGGDTSFHNRRNYSLMYVTPSIGKVNFGVLHSYDASNSDPGGPGTKLNSVGVRWNDKQRYAAFLIEQHIDWLPMSAGSASTPESIRNDGLLTRSRDVGYRLALGWNPRDFQVGFDLAQLNYRERSATAEKGRFSNYQNETAQLTVQYLGIERWRFALNATFANAGKCEFTGGLSCSTENLGGQQVSAGFLFSYNHLVSVFGLATKLNNNPASRYGSLPQGADALIYALGVKLERR